MVRRRHVKALLRSIAVLVALATVTTTLFAGHRYFFCAPMSRIAFEDCCARADADDEDHHAHEAAIDAVHRCCESRTFDDATKGTSTTPSADVPGARLVALVPPLPRIHVELPANAAPVRAYDTRAGPRGRPPSSPLAFRVPVDVSRS